MEQLTVMSIVIDINTANDTSNCQTTSMDAICSPALYSAALNSEKTFGGAEARSFAVIPWPTVPGPHGGQPALTSNKQVPHPSILMQKVVGHKVIIAVAVLEVLLPDYIYWIPAASTK